MPAGLWDWTGLPKLQGCFEQICPWAQKCSLGEQGVGWSQSQKPSTGAWPPHAYLVQELSKLASGVQ